MAEFDDRARRSGAVSPGSATHVAGKRPAGTGIESSRLDISRPTDPVERDAEWKASQVLSDMPIGSSASCTNCGAHLPGTTVARRAIPGGQSPDPFVGGLGAGRGLDHSTRSFFEPRFDRNFGAVRLHTGPAARRAAAAINAQAFTVGRDIAIGAGTTSPESASGRRLLAHELAHVVQQDGGTPAIHRVGAADPMFPYTAAEREMDRRVKAEQAAKEQAEEQRHRAWQASHQADHKQFLAGQRTTLAQDIVTTQQQLVEQRMALLAEAAKSSAPAPFDPRTPFPMNNFDQTTKLVIPATLTRLWANAQQQTVVLRALLSGKQLTPEDAAAGRAAYLAFFQTLIPLSDTADRNEADRERMSRSLADSWRRQQSTPCPNCHTPNPTGRQEYHAPPPSTPELQKSLDLVAGAQTDADWNQAVNRFLTATKVMDAIVLSTVAADHPAAAGFTFARDLLERQLELQKREPDAVRIRAVFYPEDKWVKTPDAEGKEVEIASGIPWYFYLTHTPTPSDTSYPDGFSWTLRDITSPKRPEVSYEPSDVERYLRLGVYSVGRPPSVLFRQLNNKLVFPKGIVYWTNPDGSEDSLKTTEPWSLSDWLGAIGIGIAGLALILSTGGLATPAVLVGLGVASAAFGVASTLADLHEKSELGILTQEDKNRAILFIAADIASALSLGLGHAAAELGRAAATAGRVSKLAIVVQRTAKLATAVDQTLGTAVLVTMSADFVGQYQAIAQSNLSPAEREKALQELTASALFTGAVILAPHMVQALGSGLRSGEPRAMRDPQGLHLGDAPTPVATVVRAEGEPHPGWSKPHAENEFTQWSTKQETLPPEQAAHELQAADAGGPHRELPRDAEFKQEIGIEDHTWKEKRDGLGWCRFTTRKCYTNAQLKVSVKGTGERVTATSKQDVARLRADLQKAPGGKSTEQARLDWTDYTFYAERRLTNIDAALDAGTTPPAPPRTFASFQQEHPPGSVVRNEIQGSRFEARSRGVLEDALGPARAQEVLNQPHLSESTDPTVGKGELTRPESIFANSDGKGGTAITNKSRSSFVDASAAAVRGQVNRDLEEAVEKYSGVRQVRRTGQQVDVTRVWLLYDADMVPIRHRETVRTAVKDFQKAYRATGLTFEVGIF